MLLRPGATSTTRQKSSASPTTTWCRIAASAPQARAADQLVHPATHRRHSQLPPYQPFLPPMPMHTVAKATGGRCVDDATRADGRRNTVPPAQSGSPGIAPGVGPRGLDRLGFVHACRAHASIASRASSAGAAASAACGRCRRGTRCGCAVLRPAGGRSSCGTGVTRWIHSELSRGVSTGTGSTRSDRPRPRALAISAASAACRRIDLGAADVDRAADRLVGTWRGTATR